MEEETEKTQTNINITQIEIGTQIEQIETEANGWWFHVTYSEIYLYRLLTSRKMCLSVRIYTDIIVDSHLSLDILQIWIKIYE